VLRAGIHLHCQRAAVGVAQRGLEAFGQALLGVGANFQPVDHDFDGVLPVLVELGHGIDLVHLAVDPYPHEALSSQFGEEFEILALAPYHQRGEDHELGVFRQRQHGVDHLRHGLRGQGDVVFRTLRITHPRVQQAQVVVDFGDGADGRARVVAGGFLLDRDRRRQSLDQIDVGLFHQLQELPRVGRQRLDIAPLAFGIEGVERQRRLARTRQPGDHHQLVARQIEVDVLEIVGASTTYADEFHVYSGGVWQPDNIADFENSP
jgi:hypothetical protein